MKFDIKAILEWSLIAVVFLAFIIWVAYTRPAQAQGVYYEEDQGGRWMNPNAPTQPGYNRPAPYYQEPRSRYYPEERPDHYGPVEQRPEITIHRGPGYRRY